MSCNKIEKVIDLRDFYYNLYRKCEFKWGMEWMGWIEPVDNDRALWLVFKGYVGEG